MKLKFIFLISTIIILLSAVPFYCYFQTFNGRKSFENTDWGTFGDFIGGTLNPILALLNLIVFIYFTYIIHEFEKNSKYRELTFQRNLINSGEKYKLFKNINHSVNKIRFILLSNIEKKSEAITELFENCDSCFADIKLLFPDVKITDEETDDIQVKFLKLIKEVKYIEQENIKEFTNAFGFSKIVIQSTSVILKRLKESIENDLKTNNSK